MGFAFLDVVRARNQKALTAGSVPDESSITFQWENKSNEFALVRSLRCPSFFVRPIDQLTDNYVDGAPIVSIDVDGVQVTDGPVDAESVLARQLFTGKDSLPEGACVVVKPGAKLTVIVGLPPRFLLDAAYSQCLQVGGYYVASSPAKQLMVSAVEATTDASSIQRRLAAKQPTRLEIVSIYNDTEGRSVQLEALRVIAGARTITEWRPGQLLWLSDAFGVRIGRFPDPTAGTLYGASRRVAVVDTPPLSIDNDTVYMDVLGQPGAVGGFLPISTMRARFRAMLWGVA